VRQPLLGCSQPRDSDRPHYPDANRPPIGARSNYVVEEDPIPCTVVGGESGIITPSVEELL
jgi:hypothetical protein